MLDYKGIEKLGENGEVIKNYKLWVLDLSGGLLSKLYESLATLFYTWN